MLKLNTSVSFDFCPHYLFGLFLVVTINIDIIIMQIDRFVAVSWSLEYPAFATNGKAVLVCCVSKILPSAISFTVLFLDTEYLKCADIFLLFFTRTTNMIFISCLNLSVTTFVGIVSSYLGFKMVKIKKTVNPIVNLQVMLPKTPATVPEMSDTNVTGRKICVKRIDDQPNMFYSIKMKETTVEGEQSGVRNPTAEQAIENTIQSDSNISKVFIVAKTALNMNYVVICICLINTPRSILSIIYHDCDQSNGECNVFLLLCKLFFIPEILAVFAVCYMFLNKIKNTDIE
jgi:hypothetical protein